MTSVAPAQPREEQGEPKTGLILAVCCVAQFMVILDLSIVNVALPTIQAALRISSTSLQWVIDAYAILFAGFLMLAGRATDIFGQRRTFGAALLGFALASLVGGLAPSSDVLIVARGVQGLAGAGMAAASLAIITSTFPPGPQRHRAIALWGAMNGAGGAAGTLAGGVLTDALSWRWILLINVPIGIAAWVIAQRAVAERRAERRPGFDLAGALLLTAGLLIATYGGVTAGSHGFGSADALVPIAIGSIMLTFFPLVEKRVKDPLVPPDALTKPLKRINIIVLLFSSSLFAMWFASSLYLQQVLSLSPLETGLVFLPMALTMFFTARPAGKLTSRAGVRPVLGGGLIMLAVGLLLLSRIGPGGSAIQYVMLPGLLVAVGIGCSVVASTIAATMSAGPAQAGLSSALVNTARQVGGGLGLAVLISLATRETSVLIGDGEPIAEALTDGFALAYLVGACLVAVAAVLTFLWIPGGEPATRPLGRKVLGGVATLVALFLVVEVAVPRSQAAPPGEFTTDGAMSFVTEPELHPPQLHMVKKRQGPPADGFLLTANFLDVTKPPIIGQSGPLILDDNLQPVWFKPVPTDVVAANLDVHEYKGKPVLAWWEGDVGATGEINTGRYVLVDESYREVATIEGSDGWVLTLHSLYIRDGIAWVTANRNVRENLSKLGGVNNGVLMDSGVLGIEIETGKLVSTWSARDHIPLEESETQPPPNGFPWDAYHINWLQLVDGGRMLVSMRNTHAGYLFDMETGEIEWTLGGKNSTFDLEPEAEFEWQHDIEFDGDKTVTLFDNHCCEITGAGEYLPSDRGSRALVLELDMDRRTARVVRQFSHGETFRAQYMGNEQELANGNRLVNWGQVPYVSEFTPDGEIIFDAAFPGPNMTYRAHRREWVGRPQTKPRAVRQGENVLVSWNGATEVARWKVLAGGTEVAERPKEGFETAIGVPGGGTDLEVQALDANGQVLGTAEPTTPTTEESG
jgi:EmrB/QacA subfamily drug resistance transporter